MEGKNYFINRLNNFIDPSFQIPLKKRIDFLKELKNLINFSNEKFKEFTTPTVNNNKIYNGSTLHIDTIFNPITKVNYIIEENENILVNNTIEKYSFVENLTTLINSNKYIEKNFPYLKQCIPDLFNNSLYNSYVKGTIANTNLGDEKQLLDYIEKTSIIDLDKFYPLKNKSLKHTIILEIWTNGSIHPRDALIFTFQHLSFLFLNCKSSIRQLF